MTDQSNDNSIRSEGEAFDPLDPIHDLPHGDVTDAADTTDTADIGDTTVDPAILQRLTHDDRGRLRIHIDDDTAMYDELVDRIGTGDLDYIYRNGESMVMATEEGINMMTADKLASHINKKLVFTRRVGEEERRVLIRTDVARQLASTPETCPEVRRLHGVLRIPTMRHDGSIISEPGYDESSGYVYIPNGVTVNVPEHPTTDDISRSSALVSTPFLEYNFKFGDHGVANTIGTVITPALKLFDSGHRKAVKIGANGQGSGKSYIPGGLSTIYDGVMHPPPENNTEMKKTITSVLREPGSVVYFDNVRGKVNYTSLEALLTSDRWASRLLGSTKTVNLVNDRLWLMTTNGMQPTPDLARRLLCIDIISEPDPTKQVFTIRDLDRWFREHREEYLSAVLTLVRAWIQAGRPMPDDGESDSFSHWRRTIRGILQVAGVPGVFDAECTRVVDTEETDDGAAFLSSIFNVFGENEFTARDVTDVINDKIDLDSVPERCAKRFISGAGDGFSRSVGRWFKDHDSWWFGGFAVTNTAKRKNVKIFRVIQRSV